MLCLITLYTSNLFLSCKRHCQLFCIVGWLIVKNVMARKSPTDGPTTPMCYFGISSALIFARKPRSESVTYPFLCSVRVGEWPIIFGQAAPHNAPATSDMLSLASQYCFLLPPTQPPTHSLSIYLSPQRTNQESKKLSLRQHRKSKAILARKLAEPRKGCG